MQYATAALLRITADRSLHCDHTFLVAIPPNVFYGGFYWVYVASLTAKCTSTTPACGVQFSLYGQLSGFRLRV